MPTIGNAPLGEDSSIDGTEKIPLSGSKWSLLSAVLAYIISAFTAASESAAGKVALATSAEINTGTDAARAMSPDAFAGSNHGTVAFAVEVFAATTPLSTGDGKKYIPIPAKLAGMNLIRLHAILFAKSTSGTPTVQIARGRRADATSAHTFADVLSTLITVDANEFDSRTASAPPAINASNDDLADGDLLRVDVDVAGTAATGMWVTFEAQLP